MAKKVLSLNKIIFLILVICLILLGALFFYRSHHPASTVQLTADNGVLFSAPREIRSFELMATNQQKFTINNLLNHWTLVFFGFTHCQTVCPTTLDMLKRAYTSLEPHYPNLQVVLISLDPERDSLNHLRDYVLSFHRNFIGVTGDMGHLRQFQSQLNVFSTKSGDGKNYQIQHTSSIFLINPKGQWVGLLRYGMNPKQFIQAFEESMAFL